MKKLRDNDFVRQCEICIECMAANGGKVDLRRVVEHVVAHGEARYYVELDHAVRVRRLLRRQHTPDSCTLRRQMWNEIMEKASNAMRRNRHLKPSDAIARVIMTEKASRFFISTATGLDILRRHLKTKRLISA